MNRSTLSIFKKSITYFNLSECAKLDFGPSLANYLPTIIIFMHFNIFFLLNRSTLSICKKSNTDFTLAECTKLDFGTSLANYLPTIIIFMHFNRLWARKKHSQSWEWKQGGASFYAQTSYLLTLHSYIFSRKVGIEKTFLTEGFNAIRPWILIKTSTA